jgi:hypothetical protein
MIRRSFLSGVFGAVAGVLGIGTGSKPAQASVQPPASPADVPDTLYGYPVIIEDASPDVARPQGQDGVARALDEAKKRLLPSTRSFSQEVEIDKDGRCTCQQRMTLKIVIRSADDHDHVKTLARHYHEDRVPWGFRWCGGSMSHSSKRTYGTVTMAMIEVCRNYEEISFGKE